MAYCWKCGVELEESACACPLCATPVPRLAEAGAADASGKPPDLDRPVDTLASLGEKHPYQLWMIVSVPFLTALLVVLSLSLRAEAFPAWGAYAIGSVVAGWAIVSLFLVIARAPIPALSGIGVTIAALLFFFDLLDAGAGWFLPLALPIVLAGYLFTIGITLIFSAKGPKGLHSVGFTFLAAAALSLAIDGIVSLHLAGSFDPQWSLVADSALVPFALLFILLHYAFKKRVRFKRYFHL
jgi:hypothetical protein